MPDPCKPIRDEIEALEASLARLQEELKAAAPPEKPAIIEQINELNAQIAQKKREFDQCRRDNPLPDASPVQEAIARFERSSTAGVWPYIQKSALIADVRATVQRPLNVDQDGTPFCGPGAIVYELVSRDPLRYVQICQRLYETGMFHGRTKEVRASRTLLNSRVPSGITPADWMLMATMRDAENALFEVEGNMSDYVGITTPWEMKGWAYELLRYNNVDWESTYFYGEFEAARAAARARNAGGVAFLMIHSALLTGSTPTVAYPDHWISFLGGLQIDEGVWYVHDDGRIRFDCYTWGSTRHVDVGEGKFEDYMWGLATGV